MKTINYTGSSKLISRIVNLLNRKAPLPLDGDGDPVWGTNGQVLSTDGNGNTAWVNQGGGGSGGHTIEDTSGADLPQEDNLQFADAKVTDDSGNSRTKVEVIRPITESQISSISEDGVYVVTDGQQISINAADVAYNGGSVAGALNSLSSLQSVIDATSQITVSATAFSYNGLKYFKYGKFRLIVGQVQTTSNIASEYETLITGIDPPVETTGFMVPWNDTSTPSPIPIFYAPANNTVVRARGGVPANKWFFVNMLYITSS